MKPSDLQKLASLLHTKTSIEQMRYAHYAEAQKALEKNAARLKAEARASAAEFADRPSPYHLANREKYRATLQAGAKQQLQRARAMDEIVRHAHQQLKSAAQREIAWRDVAKTAVQSRRREMANKAETEMEESRTAKRLFMERNR